MVSQRIGLIHYKSDPSKEEYINVYDLLKRLYELVFVEVFSDEDYNFLISKHKDLTDLLLDVLKTDYRTVNLNPAVCHRDNL